MSAADKRTFIAMRRESEAFDLSYLKLARALLQNAHSHYVSRKSLQRLFHGSKHVISVEEKSREIEMRESKVECATSFSDLVDGDLSIIGRSLSKIVDGLQREFAKGFYETVSKACDESGNKVDVKLHVSEEEALLAMIEKVQFIADKSEHVEMPQIHASPQQAEKLMRLEKNQSPEFSSRFEAIKTRKIAEAIQRERDRKGRFKRYGNA